ncbi:MAG: aldehyde ferredoxin oxidoreductase family protein [Anaerolineales bacterium]|nr:aldehyde ferredoxin oxidoreductase family protein [Anaerolineales bacterium]
METINYQVDYSEAFKKRSISYTGKVLHVDLSQPKIWHEEPDPALYRSLLGGRGFILHYLLTEMPVGADPLGPENVLVFAAGLLTGTVLPGTGRHAVGAKSPLTGALASSEAGGFFGYELKKSGFDAVVFYGQAPQPVYLWINNGRVELRPADHLWGRNTGGVEEQLKDELEDDRIRVAQIGPGGENQVLFASIMHDINRAAGRSGLGAVMGSKMLKAVVVRGTSSVGLANKAALKNTLKWITDTYKDSMGWAMSYGTPGSFGANHESGALALKNYLVSNLDGYENLSHEKFFEKMVVDRDTCSHCPVRCKLVVEHDSPRIERKYGGPEYESLGSLGALPAVTDPVAVSKANELCAAYGLDTISTGATIAFTMECVERGILNSGNFLPVFGSGDDLIKAVHLIARREGLGDLMALGSARMAEHLGQGTGEFLAVARKQELPLHDPRMKNVLGMGYALSPTGADHMHNMFDNFANFEGSDVCVRLNEMGLETPLPMFGITSEKVRAYYYAVAFKFVLDSSVICHFYPYRYQNLLEAFQAAAGWENLSIDEINTVGQRIITMARLFVLREGGSHADDNLTDRALYPLPDGPIAGRTIKKTDLEEGIQQYFKLIGWDTDGVPTRSCLEELSVVDYA